MASLYVLTSALCFALLLSGAQAQSALRTFRTDHYVVHTDLDDDLARDMADELEFAYREFTRRLGLFENAGRPGGDRPFNVYLFAGQADYVSFAGGEFPNTGGLFVSKKRALAVYLEGQGREQMRKTLRHEAFHQYAFERIGPGLPVWLNEGLAQLFEESVRLGAGEAGGLRIGLVTPERLRQLQHDVSKGRLMDIETILRLEDDAWAQTLADRGRAATQYTQAWAMVHFLIYAQDAAGRPLYRDRFNAMLTEIGRGGTGWVAFNKHFGTNFDGFRDRFLQYVQGLRATPEAQAMDDQRVLAELLVLLHQRGMRFESVEAFRAHVMDRKYRLECRRDEVTWSTDPDPAVYFRDAKGRPLDARQLRFQPDPRGEMPALVRRPGDGLVYKTRFYVLGDKTLHETLCEAEAAPSLTDARE